MVNEKLIRSVAAMLTDGTRTKDLSQLPQTGDIENIMQSLRRVLFAEYLGYNDIEEMLAALARQLTPLVENALSPDDGDASESVSRFLTHLPSLKDLLQGDVEATLRNDPAVHSAAEVVSCYPVVTAMLHYRVANALHRLGIPLLPRIITELAHSATGIDIHPAATIGRQFCIDHGTGVVIGATTIIGDNVTIYQGVTLGAKNFVKDERGLPLDLPRHPIIGDRVVIYSNSTVLGRVTIGHDSVVGGNVWLTRSLPPHSRVLQHRPSGLPTFEQGAGI